MNNHLKTIAQGLVEKGKGILAADESVKTMTKRLAAINVDSTLENRSTWRQIILETQRIENYLSGVILYDETLTNPLPNGKMIADILKEKGIMIGIKTDEGTFKFNEAEETFTLGLDHLVERYKKYKKLGAVFAKWRSVYRIDHHLPSKPAITANAIGLAQYALITQKSGLVPIVEPEVLVLEGSHDITISEKITQEVLKAVFYWLKEFQVELSGILLKSNMVLAGKDSFEQPSVDQIVEKTFNVLKNTVPEEVPGIVFLSGGLSPDEATNYLRELNKRYPQSPWQLSFSYGRALQQEALKVWGGKKENIKAAQQTFLERAAKVSKARDGK